MSIINFGDIVTSNGKTIRENNLAQTHKYPVDTLVEVKYDEWMGNGACMKVHARFFIVHHTRDCDGTPLYVLGAMPTSEWLNATPSDVFDYPSRLTFPQRILVQALHKVAHGFHSEDALTPVELTPEVARGDNALSWEVL